MSYADKKLACRDCGARFVFTAGEQEYYAQKGFANEPSRCASCRQAHKQTQHPSTAQPNGQRSQHSAICTLCGKATLVPFLPRSNKPIYCNNCYQQRCKR